MQADWLYRFRLASGLPVGGWGVLRTEPEAEARLGSDLVARDGLDLYVAKPEVEYEFSAADGQSHERSGRSSRFFLAETPMTDADWRALGAAIDQRGIAARPG